MKEYTLEEIEAMVDDMPECKAKVVAKRAMNLIDKAGIPKGTKIIDPDLDEQINYEVKSTEKVFRLSDEEIKALIKKDVDDGR